MPEEPRRRPPRGITVVHAFEPDERAQIDAVVFLLRSAAERAARQEAAQAAPPAEDADEGR